MQRPSRLERLHSLSGIVPLGLFTVVHLVANGSAMSGDAAYARIARPIAFPVALVVIYLPLAFHLGYGLWLVATRRTLGQPPPNRSLWILQRVTSVAVLGFLGFHVIELRVNRMRTGLDPAALYTKLTEHLAWTWSGVPVIAAAYLFGIAAVCFHLTYGFWTFFRPERRRTFVLGGVGILLFMIGAGSVLSLSTGSRFLPAASSGPKPSACPPAP